MAPTRINSLLVILTALLSALLSSAAEYELGAQPGSPGERQPGAWVAHTTIAERVHRGSKTVVIKDCRGVKVGGRVRLSVGRAEEEEGSVAALHCPSPGGAHVPATPTSKAEAPCDLSALGWTSPDGLDGAADDAFRPLGASGAGKPVPARCQRLLAAASRVPGLAESYRSMRRTADKLRGGSPIQPDDASAAESFAAGHGATLAVAGVITLAATTLFEHAPEASVHSSVELSGADVAEVMPACPLGQGQTPCSGRGSCEGGACVCHEDFSGRACETGCAGGCGVFGTCQGSTCVCADGYGGANCNVSSCSGGCTEKGTCVAGQCACAPGWHGARCELHTQAACVDSCGGPSRGTCSRPSLGSFELICLCKSHFIGATCLVSIADCGTEGCNGNGDCVSAGVSAGSTGAVAGTSGAGAGSCRCFPGYSGVHCETMSCPQNCTSSRLNGEQTTNGRCSASEGCVCKDGFSGPACNQECPHRCFGHGECTNGVCSCRDGYTDYDCSKLALQTPWEIVTEIFVGGLMGYYPVLLVMLLALLLLTCFCLSGYLVNRWRGRYGTAAVPMWEYYAKTWRNAPLFEPIFAVSAATQTPPPPPQAKNPRRNLPESRLDVQRGA